jgi:hypothetical protein
MYLATIWLWCPTLSLLGEKQAALLGLWQQHLPCKFLTIWYPGNWICDTQLFRRGVSQWQWVRCISTTVMFWAVLQLSRACFSSFGLHYHLGFICLCVWQRPARPRWLFSWDPYTAFFEDTPLESRVHFAFCGGTDILIDLFKIPQQ